MQPCCFPQLPTSLLCGKIVVFICPLVILTSMITYHILRVLRKEHDALTYVNERSIEMQGSAHGSGMEELDVFPSKVFTMGAFESLSERPVIITAVSLPPLSSLLTTRREVGVKQLSQWHVVQRVTQTHLWQTLRMGVHVISPCPVYLRCYLMRGRWATDGGHWWRGRRIESHDSFYSLFASLPYFDCSIHNYTLPRSVPLTCLDTVYCYCFNSFASWCASLGHPPFDPCCTLPSPMQRILGSHN